jgi:hypothetical protein
MCASFFIAIFVSVSIVNDASESLCYRNAFPHNLTLEIFKLLIKKTITLCYCIDSLSSLDDILVSMRHIMESLNKMHQTKFEYNFYTTEERETSFYHTYSSNSFFCCHVSSRRRKQNTYFHLSSLWTVSQIITGARRNIDSSLQKIQIKVNSTRILLSEIRLFSACTINLKKEKRSNSFFQTSMVSTD